MNISCQLASESYAAGGLAIFLLKGDSKDYQNFKSSLIFANAHAYIDVNFRWLRGNSAKLAECCSYDPSSSLESSSTATNTHPFPAANHSHQCIFFTPRIALVPSQIFSSGLFLEFELPHECLPSFKGLCASINYYMTLQVQLPTGAVHFIHFPFSVVGNQCTFTKSFPIRCASIVAYPVSSLPRESCFLSPDESESTRGDFGMDYTASQGANNVYNIRNVDFVCFLHFPSATVFPGQEIVIFLDFTDSVELCKAVKASIIMCEMRSDGSRIQDKIVNSVIRSTVDAETVRLVLNVPFDAACSFEFPLFKVSYRLDMEFCLDPLYDKADLSSLSEGIRVIERISQADALDRLQAQSSMFENSVSFSIPLNMTLPKQMATVSSLGCYSRKPIVALAYNG